MKFLIILLSAILAPALMAERATNPFTYRVDTSLSNLSPTFPVGPQLTGPTTAFAVVQVDNQTASEIEVNCSSTTTPSSNSTTSFYVAGNTAWETPTWTAIIPSPLTSKCWFRSFSGTISTGVIRITGWGF